MPASNPIDSSVQIPGRARQPASEGDGGRLLADAISGNALFSGATGVLLLAGSVIGSWFGIDRWILAALGAGLSGFAAVLLVLLTQPRHLLLGARWVIAADAAWILGAATLLSAWPSTLSAAGRTALLGATVVVAVLTLAQLSGLRRAHGSQVTASFPLTLRVRRVIPAPPEQVWDAVADAGDYARFASGIAEITVVAGQGEGMVRQCTDDRGGRWSETCTLWEAGRRYRMTVDVGTYPIYYRALLHRFAQTWNVEPAPNGTLVTLTFDGLIKLGLLGRVAARLLGNRRRLQAILEAYEHELIRDHSGVDR